MSTVTKTLANWWSKRVERRVGLDLAAHQMRLVVLEGSESSGWRCLHAVDVPLSFSALNGLVLEDFDQIADVLRKLVQELDIQGCPVAMALPAQGVRELTWPAWDGPPQLWREPQVYKLVQQQLHLPQGAWSFDFGLDHEASSQMAWAVVARESVVQERYELAEHAGLVPTVLDIDRLAIDRLLNETCKKKAAWPALWLMWRDGVLSVHCALMPDHVCSASAYATAGVRELNHLRALIDQALDAQAIDEWGQGPVSVTFTGLQEPIAPLMDVLAAHWPHAFEQASPCTLWLDASDHSDQFAVALGLAMHPSLA